MKNNKWYEKLFLIFVFIFLYLPIIFMIFYSFSESRIIGHWSGFSLQWYEKLLTNTQMQRSFFFTIFIAVAATIISTIIGVFSAIGLYFSKKNIQNTLLSINQIPIVSPDIILGISTMLLFLLFNLRFGWITVLIAHTMFCTPIVIVQIMPKLKAMNTDLIAAANDLGANTWQMLRHAVFPSIKPGIISGALMAFTFSLDDFVVTYFTAGEGVSTLSIQIYSSIKRATPELNALSTVMFLLIIIIIIVYWFVTKNNKLETKVF